MSLTMASLGLLANLQLHDRSIELLVPDHGQQILLIQDQRLGLGMAAVKNRRALFPW